MRFATVCLLLVPCTPSHWSRLLYSEKHASHLPLALVLPAAASSFERGPVQLAAARQRVAPLHALATKWAHQHHAVPPATTRPGPAALRHAPRRLPPACSVPVARALTAASAVSGSRAAAVRTPLVRLLVAAALAQNHLLAQPETRHSAAQGQRAENVAVLEPMSPYCLGTGPGQGR